jgi:hypothetical protein
MPARQTAAVAGQRSANRGADIGHVQGLAASSHLGEDALGMTEASLTLPIPGQEADEGGWPGTHPMGAAVVALPSRGTAV